jgi:predicted ester cyclase
VQQRKRRHCPTRYADPFTIRRRAHCPPLLDDRTKRVVRRFYEQVLTHRRLDLLHDLIAPDFVGFDSAGAMLDYDGYVSAVEMLHDGFGELIVTVEDQVAEKDRVTTRWTAIGRHTGSFAGIAPTGREVMMAGTDIHRVDGHRLAELWEQVDFAGVIAQLL